MGGFQVEKYLGSLLPRHATEGTEGVDSRSRALSGLNLLLLLLLLLTDSLDGRMGGWVCVAVIIERDGKAAPNPDGSQPLKKLYWQGTYTTAYAHICLHNLYYITTNCPDVCPDELRTSDHQLLSNHNDDNHDVAQGSRLSLWAICLAITSRWRRRWQRRAASPPLLPIATLADRCDMSDTGAVF